MAENHYDLDYTGSMVDRILDTGYDLQNQGYIFRGLASHYTGTPTERTWLIAPTGSTGFGLSSPVPPGSIGICMYNGSSWSAEVLNTLTLDTSPATGSGNGITSGAVKTLAESITNAIGQLEQSVSDRFTSLELEDTTGSLQAELLSITLKYVFEGEEETLTSLSILAATAEKAGLMSAADKQKLDAFVTNIRSLRIQDTTAQADQGTEITNTLKWTIGGVTEAITAFTLYAATTSKAGLMSAADKTALDTLPSLINAGYLYAGIATPSTVPSSTDAKIFYIAIEGGTYTSFGNLNVTQGINIIYKSGNAWSAAQVVGIDNEPIAGSDSLVKSGGVKTELALGAVYDVSAHNNGATFESLSALLSDTDLNALIPTAVRKGGMSIKFVQSSDNKYVQYRLTADEWSVNTEDWAIAEEGVYVESPEFVYTKTDNKGKVLWAIKTDGSIYYGAGVPRQVIDYIEDKIAELSLDEYEDIVAFLNGLEKGDKTLQTLLNKKVDKEEGKALIDAEYASTKSTINNPEFLEVALDAEDKVLEGIRKDGTKVISGDLDVGGSAKILGEMEVAGVTYKVVESPEYLAVWVDAEDKAIFGIKPDGKTYVGDADFLNDIEDIKDFLQNIIDNDIDWDALSSITAVESLEFTEVKTDSEGKILAGRTPDGAAFENVGFSTPHINVGGFAAEHAEDPEDRVEVKTDAEDKVVSYRDKEGVLHEIAGIETDVLKAGSFSLPEDTKEEVRNIINTNVSPKKWYLPKFGSVNIKQETFYLDAGDWSSYENDVVLIQMYDDNSANASRRLTLSTFYIKNTLTPLPGGGYDRTSVNNSSVALELHAGKDVTAIGNKFFATAIYTPVMNGEYIVDYTKNKATKVLDPVSGDVIGYEYNGHSTEVKQVTDVPPYKAWKVNKNIEHYCIADIDFGTFYTKSDKAVSIKYQGSGSTQQRKRGLRITFYKNNTYAKKDKVKIGEMVRLSGFNMKSYGRSYSMVNDPVVSYVFIDMWNNRGKDAYPWNKDSVPFNGANGMIKSFPIETRIGGDFFGLQFFSLKKDEKNYMLDGDDDSSGIFVSGDVARSGWEDATPRDWADEMGADDRVVAYPDLEDSVSVETAAAMSELFKRTKGLVDGTIEIDGTVVDFDISMLEEYIDIESWIDYYIGLQVFQLWDSTYHNVILYTGSDKKKFYMYYYDLDVVCEYAYDEDIIDICRTYWNYSMDFWEKFADTYKDSIINRYAELRKNVLSIENIKSIYDSYTESIPSSVIEADVTKWNSGAPSNFLDTIEMLDKRLAWLDNNYFNL